MAPEFTHYAQIGYVLLLGTGYLAMAIPAWWRNRKAAR